MNENTTADMALDALLATAMQGDFGLPEDLIRKVYALQRRHQFEEGREVSLQELQRLVEDFVSGEKGA